MADVFYQELGARVRAARLRRGFTQAALGHALSPPVTRTSIANLEAGTQRVLAHTLAQLADALDVPVAALLGHTDDTQSLDSRIEAELARKLGLGGAPLVRLARALGLRQPIGRGSRRDPAVR